MAATKDITVRMFLERCRVHMIEPTGGNTLMRIPRGSMFTQARGATFRFVPAMSDTPFLTRRALLAALVTAKEAAARETRAVENRREKFYALAGGGPFEGADPRIKWLRNETGVEMTLILSDAIAAEVLGLIRPILLAESSRRMLLKAESALSA